MGIGEGGDWDGARFPLSVGHGSRFVLQGIHIDN